MDIALLPFYIIIVISGIIGNFLFIAVVRRRRSMRTTTNVLLVNVAISDIISLMFCMPGIVLQKFFEHPDGRLGDFLCKFITMHLMAGITLLVSGLTLTLISVERHNALLRPMDFRLKLEKRRVCIAICIIWIIAVAFVFPLFVEQKYVDEVKDCHMDWRETSSRVYWVFLAMIVGISVFIVSFCYFKIVKALYLGNILPANENSSEQDMKDKRKIIKILLTVTVLFSICFVPFIIVSAVRISSEQLLYKLSYLLVYSSCSVNPVVYTLQSANYRDGLKDLWNKRSFRMRERSLES